MLFPALVIGGGAALQDRRQPLYVQHLAFRQVEQHLRHGQQIAPVAVGEGQHGLARFRRQRQASFHMGLGAAQQLIQRRIVQPLQHIDLRPRQQRPIQLETGVLGRGPDQGDDPGLDEGQEAVLLGAVEAVDLIDEQQGALPRRPPHPRRLERLLQVGDSGKDRADRLVFIARRLGQQPGDGGLAGAGRPPQDHRAQPPRLDHPADRPARPQQMILPHHLVQRARAQTVGQGGVGRQYAGGFEQVGHECDLCRRSPKAFHPFVWADGERRFSRPDRNVRPSAPSRPPASQPAS